MILEENFAPRVPDVWLAVNTYNVTCAVRIDWDEKMYMYVRGGTVDGCLPVG